MTNDALQKTKKKFNFSRAAFIIAHLALGLMCVAIFYFYCNAKSFVMAFQRRENGETVWTLYNFIYFFQMIGDQGSILAEAFRNTFMWFGINVILTFIGVLTSYFIYKKVIGHKFFRVVFFIPGLISPIVIANIIEKMTGTQGIIAKVIQKVNNLDYVPELLVDSRYVIKTLIAKQFAFGIAGGMLIWCGTLSRIPDSIIESAKIDGVNWVQEMFLIVFPCVMPTVAITICTMIAGLFSANGGEFLYTQGEHGTMTFATWQYLQIYKTSLESNSHNLVSAIGWIITIITVPIVLITRKLSRLVGEVEY